MILQLCHILFDNITMFNIISLLSCHGLISIYEKTAYYHQFAFNRYFKKVFLLKCLLHFKLQDWVTICNVMLKIEAMEQISNQLLNGMLFAYVSIYHMCVQKVQ